METAIVIGKMDPRTLQRRLAQTVKEKQARALADRLAAQGIKVRLAR